MYTYKVGGMLITDELYHDDLDAMTFGRRDQNELYHYGIKGQSWGKRRFQNEDGSLTLAGRNRYDVGAPLSGGTASQVGGTGKAMAINRNTFASSNARPVGRTATSSSGSRSGIPTPAPRSPGYRNARSSAAISNSAQAGRRAADSLFNSVNRGLSNAVSGVNNTVNRAANATSQVASNAAQNARPANTSVFDKIGNWAGNALDDAKKWGTNAAQDVSKTATGALNDARNWATGAVEDVKGLANTPAARDIGNAVNNAREWASNAASNAGDAINDARRWAGNRLDDVGQAAGDVKNWAGDRAQDISNAAQNAGKAISNWFTGGDHGKEAERLDQISKNYKKVGDANADNGTNKIVTSFDNQYTADRLREQGLNSQGVKDLADRQFDEGLAQRDRGYDQLDKASEYRAQANAEQAKYDAAPRQRLNAAGEWISDHANDAFDATSGVRSWLGDRARDVGNAVQNVGNTVGNAAGNARDWVGDRAQDAGNFVRNNAQAVSDWFTGNKDLNAANYYRDQAQNRQLFPGTNDNIIDYQQANADANRNFANMLNYTRPRAGDVADRLGRDQQFYDRVANDWQRAADSTRSDVARTERAAASAQERYDNAPRQVLSNAVDSARNWAGNAVQNVGNAASDARNWAGNAVQNVGNAARGALNDIQGLANTPAARDIGNAVNNARNWAGNAVQNVGNAASDARNWASDRASDIGNAASNAASSVKEWGAGALDKGRQAFENLFGKSEPTNSNPASDPTPRTFTENRIEEQRIPEQRITENRIEEQRTPEQRTYEFGDPDMVNAIKTLNDNGFFNRSNSDNTQREQRLKEMLSDKPSGVSDEYWQEYKFNGGSRAQYDQEMKARKNSSNSDNTQREQRLKEMLSDKPSGVSDEYWQEYKSNGGSRAQYDQQANARKNSQNNNSSSSDLSDKPSGVSDEYWQEYKANGGSRAQYDQQMKARKNGQNNNNSSSDLSDKPSGVSDEYWQEYKSNGGSRAQYDQDRLRRISDQQTQNGYRVSEVQAPVGTVDTSRPYHFTVDPASGQTIVVYDDDKRR